MNTQHPLRLSLACALALALLGGASIGIAQTPPPPPPPPQQPAPPPPPPAPATPAPPQQAEPMQSGQQVGGQQSGKFYQGTETSATYPLPDSHGGTLTVNAGMPAEARNYGPPPSFQSLDTNHDGRISESEAQAYPPLDSDFLYVSNQGKDVTRAQYEKWASTQH